MSETEAAALLGDAPESSDASDDAPDASDRREALDPTELLSPDDDPVAVWVMDHGTGVRSAAVGADDPDDAVIDVVVETTVGFRMFSYTGGRWMDYGTQRHDDESAPSMAGTLDSYRVLAGESTAL